MKVTGAAKLAGVMGWPIAHSLSPVLHGHWLEVYGIDGVLVPLAVQQTDFSTVLTGLRRAGFAGVNVTVPHKEAAFALADDADDAARAAGAANLLLFGQAGRVLARNTDALGLIESLKEKLGDTLAGKSVVLIGAGGAARAALLALDALRVSHIHILNRNVDRAGALAVALRGQVSVPLAPGGFADWNVAAKDAALLLNTSTAGMKGIDPLTLDLAALPPHATVCDIVYNPLHTDLLARAKACGHVVIDGLGMLMHQAAPSFEAFFGVTPQVTPALRQVLEDALAAR